MKTNFKNYWLLLVLFTINTVLLFLHWRFGQNIDFFNFDREWNLPTVWSSLQLFFAGILWFSFTEIKKNDKIKETLKTVYRFLGTGVFWYMAVDELFQLHEKAGDRGGEFLMTTSWSEYFVSNKVFAWLFVFLPVILLFLTFIIYQGLKLLSKKTFWLLFLGVLVFLMGAYGIEIIGWLVWNDKLAFDYWLVISLEEFLELTGVSIIAFVLSKDIVRK